MHISARVDYAVRILLEIARAQADSVRDDSVGADSAGSGSSRADSSRADSSRADSIKADSIKAETISVAQEIPPKILESTAAELRRAELVTSRRGPDGGYRLARPAAEISVADVIRAVEGPLASVRGQRPEDVCYGGAAESLQRVWIALRVNIRAVLERVSIAEIAADGLPDFVGELTGDPGAWQRRPGPPG